MSTPARHAILNDLEESLGDITQGNGYRLTVDTVERCIKEWDSVGAGKMPWLGFMPETERMEYQPGGAIRVIMPVVIVGHVSQTTSAAQSEALSDLVDSVVAAISADTTRDANATMTTVLDVSTDEGDPDNMPDSRGGSGSFVMRTEIVYMRTTEET
jgi:hypothetical protein